MLSGKEIHDFLDHEVPSKTKETTLQQVAEKLGVRYYADFKVVSVKIDETLGSFVYYLPIAEVYENGRWRKLVIGGRPYRSQLIAHSVKDDAQTAQEVFLKAFADVRTSQGFRLSGMSNPIDHWKYQLEN